MPPEEFKPIEQLHERITSEPDKKHLDEIPKAARSSQARNFFIHAICLSATKSGDKLVDPKLVLAWLMNAVGAPIAAIGLLVPVRESLALLPQIFTAPWIQSQAQRKWIWAAGSLTQGLCVLAIAFTLYRFEGAVAGWSVIGLLALFATARSFCSASYKSVLGRTLAKSQRGTSSGAAGTVAAATGLGFGLLLHFQLVSLSVANVAFAVAIGGGLWLVAASLFPTLVEDRVENDSDSDEEKNIWSQFRLLREDKQLGIFLSARACLTTTALAPPFLISIGSTESESGLAELGPFVVAAAFATLLSSYIWGRLSDKSSRRTLIFSAAGGAATLAIIGATALASASILRAPFVLPAALFVLMVFYQGVRLGRSTHAVDMAPDGKRASYAALGNTLIGIALLAGSAAGIVAEVFGVGALLIAFGGIAAVGGTLSLKLEELQTH